MGFIPLPGGIFYKSGFESGMQVEKIEFDIFDHVKQDYWAIFDLLKKLSCSWDTDYKLGYVDCPFCDGYDIKIWKKTGKRHEKKGSIGKVNGTFMFHCFKCGEDGDVVQLSQRRYGFRSKRELADFLKENFAPSNYLRCGSNRDLKIVGGSGTVHPHPVSYVDSNYTTRHKWLSEFLAALLEIAKKKIKNADKKFPASISEISKHTSQTYRQAAHKLYLCRLAGLIEIANIPEACRDAQEKFKRWRRVENDTSWHHIPEWTEEKIKNALEILTEANQKGINTKSCTREAVREAFGEAFEARVFHGQTTVPKWSVDFLEEYSFAADLAARMSDAEVEAEFKNLGYPVGQGTDEEVSPVTDAEIEGEFKKLGYPVEGESIEELLRRLEKETRENNRQWYGLDGPMPVQSTGDGSVRVPDDADGDADEDGFG